MRLDRYLTLCDLGSRREVKELITKNKVMVEGRIARDAGLQIHVDGMETKEKVTVNGRSITYRPIVAILLYKPEGVLTATTDKKQQTVLDLLPTTDKRRDPAPVGRLDKDTTGLLFITDDGQAAHALINPKAGVNKRYRAELDKPAQPEDIEAFAKGLELSDFTALPAKLEIGEGNTAYVTVHEGKFHQVKRMFEAVGKTVVKLHREQVGSFTIPEDMEPGDFIYLDLDTWNQLRKEAGLAEWKET